LPGRRETHPARQALQQQSAELLLERADLLGERWLRDEQPLGGAGDGARFGDCREVLELAQVYAISVAYGSANESISELWHWPPTVSGEVK
jgi:hypothetical protein